MSFGVSPSDVVKLVEFSTRIYVAFKDANDNSEAQVEGLVKEFSTFHMCLVQLEDLMKEYGKRLPFPYLDFEKTLQRCDETLKPYANHLVDNKRMTIKKFTYTIRYIGIEKEIDNLRKQINGHYQALQMCISFLQLRLHLEATKQTQRLLDSTPTFRTMSLGGYMYTSSPNALPPPSEAEELYKDWLIFNRWLKHEDERIAAEGGLGARSRSLGGTPAPAPSGDTRTAAVIYHLQRELEDAINIEENRSKRSAFEKRSSLSPSDAIRQEVRGMPAVPHIQRVNTLETEPSISPIDSPQLGQELFQPVERGTRSPDLQRRCSTSTSRTSSSTSPEMRAGASTLGVSTAETTPDNDAMLRRQSMSSLATIALGRGALEWTKLCRKVMVERASSRGSEEMQCDIFWRYREDTGISIRSLYRSGSTHKEWMVQHFPATGPSIPLTTGHIDGEFSIEFPRASFGRLEKRCTNIKYTFASAEAPRALQTLLYTNNGKDPAHLLFDRPVVSISSDKNKPESRGKNVQLWLKSDEMEGPNGTVGVDVLVLLFYTSALTEEKAHWVEEPHYVFQWLDDGVLKKSSEKLQLVFSKDPNKWSRDKLFRRRADSRGGETSNGIMLNDTTAISIDSSRISLQRSDTVTSIASSSRSIKSARSSVYGGPRPRIAGALNRFGYSQLEIKFQSKEDRRAFLGVWTEYVKPLGLIDGA